MMNSETNFWVVVMVSIVPLLYVGRGFGAYPQCHNDPRIGWGASGEAPFFSLIDGKGRARPPGKPPSRIEAGARGRRITRRARATDAAWPSEPG